MITSTRKNIKNNIVQIFEIFVSLRKAYLSRGHMKY